MTNDITRPFNDSLTLRCEPMEPLPATTKKNRYSDFELELLNADRKTRLRNVTAFGGSSKMLFVYYGEKVLKLAQEHRHSTLSPGLVSSPSLSPAIFEATS